LEAWAEAETATEAAAMARVAMGAAARVAREVAVARVAQEG